MKRLTRGDWTPARTHSTLLAVQLVALWQAGLRGLDYVGGIRAGLDAGAADPLYGWLLYGSTVLVLLGLAIRRGGPVILGHALLGAWYAGLGWDTLSSSVELNLALVGGIAVGTSGAYALLSERGPTLYRFAGVAAMLYGQYLLVRGLGVDFRAGTGLLSGGLLHATLAVGTFVLWQRQRLRRVVADDRAP